MRKLEEHQIHNMIIMQSQPSKAKYKTEDWNEYQSAYGKLPCRIYIDKLELDNPDIAIWVFAWRAVVNST